MAKFIGISSWKVRGLVRFEDNVTELNIPQVLLFNSPRDRRLSTISSNAILEKRVSIWIVKRDSRFYLPLFLSFQSSLSSPLRVWTHLRKYPPLNDTLKFEAHILRAVFDNLVGTVNFQLPPCYTMDHSRWPVNFWARQFSTPSPLHESSSIQLCVFNYRRNSFEIYPSLYSGP